MTNVQTDTVVEHETTALERARALVPLVQANAEETENTGFVTPVVAEALRDANLFSMYIPQDLGGLGLGGRASVEVIEEISYGDGSTGWGLMATAGVAKLVVANLADEAIRPIVSSGEPPIIAGILAPLGKATRTDGGYQLSGQYQFASGSAHANWISVGFSVLDAEGEPEYRSDGKPLVLSAVLPRDEVEFHGNWDVFGLRGTGSYDYSVTGKFIPTSRTFDPFEPKPVRPEPQYQLGAVEFASCGHAGVMLGLARRALTEVATLTKSKTRPGYSTSIGESDIFRHEFGRHEAMYQAARRYVLTTLDEAEFAAEKGALNMPHHNAEIRQAAALAHDIGRDVVTFAHEWAGSASIRMPSPLGRCVRDVAVATQHLTNDRGTYALTASSILESYGG